MRVDTGDQRLHFVSEGEGSPTVVLDAALAGTSLSWSRVRPGVRSFTRVVSYDRGGFGWSDPAVKPRRVDELLLELRRGLAAARIPPPYVLVGHSYGGFIARLFAARHPEDVAGMVLVDVPHPREWSKPTEERIRRVRRGAQLARRGAILARFGLMRPLIRLAARGLVVGQAAPGVPNPSAARAAGESRSERPWGWGPTALREEQGRIKDLLEKVPESERDVVRSFWVRPFTLEALASLIENAPPSAAMVEAENGDLGSLPLAVLTASSPDPERLRDQEEVTGLSSRGRHLVARRSGHWIPLDEPELVVEAIRDVLLEARQLSSSPGTRNFASREREGMSGEGTTPNGP
jgi:pimeloyl-ACP methyl ester carboxylesterase